MAADKKKEYTMADIIPHNTVDNFWTIIDDQVYDLSDFAASHPGGQIILNAAGTDGTVLFHQYHLFQLEKASAVLARYRIGNLNDPQHQSPKMGKFYQSVCSRVRDHLSHRPRRPVQAQISWFLDAILLTLSLLSAFFITTDTPIWILALVHLAIPTMSSLRMEGQQHANGHLQLWAPQSHLAWWAELYGYLLGVPAMFSYGLPRPNQNIRKYSHKARSEAQFEFPEGRGFAEHPTIHHVKGADLEHDQCFKLVSVMGILRLSNQQPVLLSLAQKYQHMFWFQTLLDIIVELADCTKLPFFFPRLYYIWHDLLPTGDFVRSLAILVGVFSGFLSSWCYLALPCSGSNGVFIFFLLAVIREYMGVYGVQVFFAQHAWDRSVPEHIANTDWGRHNAESTYSWWAASSLQDIALNAFLWGGNGSCASTLSYHLEHTLFPGLNYLYLPEVAPIVRETCQEHGVQYNCLSNHKEVIATRQEKLTLYGPVMLQTKKID